MFLWRIASHKKAERHARQDDDDVRLGDLGPNGVDDDVMTMGGDGGDDDVNDDDDGDHHTNCKVTAPNDSQYGL